jgi:hypothetical protein
MRTETIMKSKRLRNQPIGMAVVALALLLQTSTPIVWGQETDVAAEPDAESAKLESMIDQLSESSLTKRRKAKEALVEADSKAIPLLAKAALSDKRELIVYSLEVLGTLMEKSTSEETRKAARITLQMLSESDQRSTADRAKQILGSKVDEGIEAFPGWDDRNSDFAGGGGGGRNVSVSSVNGAKTIRVEEGGRVTTLRDEARGRIRVSIEDGDKKKQFVARNLEDLKKKDADAGALYEEQSNGVSSSSNSNVSGGVPQGGFSGGFAGGSFSGGFAGGVNGGGLNGGMQQGMGNFNAKQFGGAFGGNAGNAANDQAGKLMMIQQLEELKRRMGDNPAMTQMLDAQIQALKQP